MKDLIERLLQDRYELPHVNGVNSVLEAVDALMRLTAERDTLFNRAITAEFENAALRADAERYRYIRTGEVFIEPMTHDNGVKEFYAAVGELPGKYYVDMRAFDMDVDAEIEGENK